MSKPLKASLSELFAACNAIVCAGICGHENKIPELVNLGLASAKISFRLKTALYKQLSDNALVESSVEECIKFLRDSRKILSNHTDQNLLSSRFKLKGELCHRQLGTIEKLVEEINSILLREEEGALRADPIMDPHGSIKSHELKSMDGSGVVKARDLALQS